jgi:hypothetical protein
MGPHVSAFDCIAEIHACVPSFALSIHTGSRFSAAQRSLGGRDASMWVCPVHRAPFRHRMHARYLRAYPCGVALSATPPLFPLSPVAPSLGLSVCPCIPCRSSPRRDSIVPQDNHQRTRRSSIAYVNCVALLSALVCPGVQRDAWVFLCGSLCVSLACVCPPEDKCDGRWCQRRFKGALSSQCMPACTTTTV